MLEPLVVRAERGPAGRELGRDRLAQARDLRLELCAQAGGELVRARSETIGLALDVLGRDLARALDHPARGLVQLVIDPLRLAREPPAELLARAIARVALGWRARVALCIHRRSPT